MVHFEIHCIDDFSATKDLGDLNALMLTDSNLIKGKKYKHTGIRAFEIMS